MYVCVCVGGGGSNSTLRKLCVCVGGGGRGEDKAEHFQFSGGFEGLLEPDLHCEVLVSYMYAITVLQTWNCQVVVCTVCFLFVQPVSSLSVQSVSYLYSLFLFVCAICFLLRHNGDAEQTTATSTHCLRHCMQRFPKFLLFLTLSLRIKSCGRLLRQSVRNKSKFGKGPWCVIIFILSLSTGTVMRRILYSTPIDRTRDVSYSLFHPYRQDPWCVLYSLLHPYRQDPWCVSYSLFHPYRQDPWCVVFFIPPLSAGPVMCRILYSTPIDRTRDVLGSPLFNVPSTRPVSGQHVVMTKAPLYN